MSMSSFFDMFSTLNGVVAIFKLGFVPKDSEFYELTTEQYQHYYTTAPEANEHLDEKLYMILPEDSQKCAELASESVFVLTEKDITTIKKAEELIEEYCKKSGKEFNNFEEKLYYCASVMPDVVAEGTKYEKFIKIDFSMNRNKTDH